MLEFLARMVEPHFPGLVKWVLAAVAVGQAGASLYLRFVCISDLLSPPTPIEMEPAVRLNKLRLYHILCYTFAESLAVCRQVLRFLGEAGDEVTLLFLGAGGLILLCYPHVPGASRQ